MQNNGKNQNNDQMQNLINTVSQRLGTNPEALGKAAKQGNLQNLLNQMDQNQAKKIQQILNDKEASEKLLNTPQAKALLKKLMGGE